VLSVFCTFHFPILLHKLMHCSQNKIMNKQKAMQVLLTRLQDKENNLIHAERSIARANQVGSGERMEKIRTYNFAQNRVTDHRCAKRKGKKKKKNKKRKEKGLHKTSLTFWTQGRGDISFSR
jgi:protein subunit release factor A